MSRAIRGKRKSAPRLGRDAWLEAALDALAAGGVADVRVETLAQELGVTKGSFYWHFRDRADLLAALLQQWRGGRSAAIAAQAEASGGKPAERLQHLLDLYLDRNNPRGMAIELAIRDWARRDADAVAVVAEVDAARLGAVSRLYAEMGCDAREASARALAFYSFIFGQSLIVDGGSTGKATELRERCAQLLIGR
jgi:AcrR family transcriptional regulator